MTTFERIYEAVKLIPEGSVATYGQVAEAAGSKRLSRVVGYALHANPQPGIIPCHRVVSSSKGIGGYTLGTDLKRKLLCMEGAVENELDLE